MLPHLSSVTSLLDNYSVLNYEVGLVCKVVELDTEVGWVSNSTRVRYRV